jgi:MoaA/NifB/PqqE/SkfB family radical SAM enzyme
MTLETFKRVLETHNHAANISIVGNGEPLLNRQFYEMVSYAASVRRARVTTLTNGFFQVTDVDSLLDSGLDLISISLKSYDADDFFRLTGLGRHIFQTVVDNTRELVRRRSRHRPYPSVAASFILDKHNYLRITQMLDLADSLGVDQVKFDPFIPLPMSGFRLNERCITTSDRAAITAVAGEAPYKQRMKIRPPVAIDLHKKDAICDSFFRVLRVNSDGFVSGCIVSHSELESGHSFEERNVWNSPYFQKMRTHFIHRETRDLPSVCRQCHQYCGQPLW